MRSASNCSVRGRYYQSKFDTDMITYLFFRNCHGTSHILSDLYGVLSTQLKKLFENQFEEGMSVKFCDLNGAIFFGLKLLRQDHIDFRLSVSSVRTQFSVLATML